MSRSRKGAGPLGFEDTLWKTADKLKGSMDASEYKHVVLGVVFLQPRSTDCPELTRPRIRGKCLFFSPARNAVGVPPGEARQPEIGKFIDTAMNAVEIENSSLRGVLPKNFARPGLDVRRLGEMVHLIAGLGLGAAKHRQKDLSGRVYKYFFGRFLPAEGKADGKSYIPAVWSHCGWI